MGRQRSLDVISKLEYVTIGELVRLTNVRYSTLKFYTEEGLIPFEQAEENLTRRYNRLLAIQKINEIIKLRENGLSMNEIKTKLLDQTL
jgi:DNA-binding transcriptional MerR regulator